LELGAHYNRSEIDSVLLLFPALAELMDRRAELLSGGEQQMLALARALASKPRLLLVDELSMGLAPIIVERVLPILRTAADAGIGVLLVEPHPQGALGIADRAYVLAHGDLVLEGDARYVSDNMEKVEESYLGKLDEPASRM
jgi:branched-chain amino acid transport system ATP-binding protein